MNLKKIEGIYLKSREQNVIPGSYRIQNLLNFKHFHTLTKIPSILIGGTNGKGSTCAYIESILRHSGFKTGLYTSPHICSPSERIRINGDPISEKEILKTLNDLVCDSELYLSDASFFELMTAAALIVFSKNLVDVIVCEVGLGGRFDSTNALSPIISVLTSVSLDHTHILGKTTNSIAFDKSHIARKNRIFVVDDTFLSKKTLQIIKKTSVDKIGSKLVLTSQKFPKFYTGLFEKYSKLPYSCNLKTALIALWQFFQTKECIKLKPNLKINRSIIEIGIKKTFWPGRFDIRKVNQKTCILDSAHNPHATKIFIQQYRLSRFSKLKFDLLFASYLDKNWKENLKILASYAKKICLTSSGQERSQNPKVMFQYVVNKKLHDKVSYCFSLKEALEQTIWKSDKEPVVILGSIAFIGSVFERLKLNVFEK